MAFTSTKTPAGLICIGFGTPTVDVTTSTATTSPHLASLTTFQGSGIVRTGWIKIRVIGVTSLVVTTVDITGTDGTTTVFLGAIPATAAGTSGRGCEYLVPFMSELSLTTVTVTVTSTGGTSPTFDCELVGNP